MKCTECNGTRVYYGLGTAPPEPCRACQPQSTPKVCRSSWQGLEFGCFQATIDEWFEALQARIDAIIGQ